MEAKFHIVSLAHPENRGNARGMEFRLKEMRNAHGFTQEQVAEMLGVSVSLYNGLEKGGRRMNSDYLEGLANIYNVQPSEMIVEKRASIAVPGRAGAGAEVHLVDDYAKGDGLFHVECPPLLSPRGIVAVEVEGNSMEPAYTEGDLLFYSRDALGVPTEAIGRMCIAADEAGRVWVKQVKIGTAAGLFNLLSINPSGANMIDVRLKWAAPVKLHLPKEFVRKV